MKIEGPQKEGDKGFGIAARMGLELVVGTLVGGGLGYLSDKALGTKPWLMIVGLFLGAIAGFRNIFLYLSDIENKQD